MTMDFNFPTMTNTVAAPQQQQQPAIVLPNTKAYEPVPLGQLSDATKAAMYKFLKGICEGAGVGIKAAEKGMRFPSGDVWTQPLPVGALSQAVTNFRHVEALTLTLGDLSASANNEKFEQIIPDTDKVESLAKAVATDGHLIIPITVGLLEVPAYAGQEPGYEVVILSGRNRTSALLTLFQVVPNWEDLELSVFADDRFKTVAQMITAVEAYNTSRSVTKTEKSQFRLTAKGITATDSFEAITAALREGVVKLGMGDLGHVARLAGRNYIVNDPQKYRVLVVDRTLGTLASPNSVGEYAAGLMSAFSHTDKSPNQLVTQGLVTDSELKELKKLAYETATFDGQERVFLTSFLMDGLDTLVNQWQSYFEQLSKGTNSINFAVRASKIGKVVGESVLVSYLDELREVKKAYEEAKESRKKESKAKSLSKQLQPMLTTYKQLQALGSALSQEQLNATVQQLAIKAKEDLGIAPEVFYAYLQSDGKLDVQATPAVAPAVEPQQVPPVQVPGAQEFTL